MERSRYGTTTANASSSQSQLMRPSVITNNGSGGPGPSLSSFIPTASASASASSHNNSSSSSSKLAQQLALQSQLQAQSHNQLSSSNTATAMMNHHQHNHHNHVHHHQQQQMRSAGNGNGNSTNVQNHYYQNLPSRMPAANQHAHGQGGRSTIPTAMTNTGLVNGGLDGHHSQMQPSRHHPPNSNNYNQVGPQYGNTGNVIAAVSVNGGFYGTLTQGKPLAAAAATHPHPSTPSIQPVIQQIQQQHLSTQISQQIQQQPDVLSDGGLPSTLVESMRTLFDILDDMKQGKVRLSDIESRWENQNHSAHGHHHGGESNGPINGLKGNTGAEPLIKMGVLEYLRKVTPPDGMLTFDRFCAGLKLALLTNNNNAHAHAGQYIHHQNTQNTYGTAGHGHSNNSGPVDHGSNYGQQRPQQLYRNGHSAPALQVHQQQQQMPNHANKTVVMQNGPLPPQQQQQQLQNSTSSGTMQRVSKIPGMSRLPTSGIPLSPTNRAAPPVTGNGNSNNTVLYQNQNAVPGPKRNGILPQHQHQHQQQLQQLQQFQPQPIHRVGPPHDHNEGTTVALVHQPPPVPNPKPVSNHSKIKSTIEALVGHSTGSSSTAKHHHYNFSGNKTKHNYTTKNGSLDNLTSDNPIAGANAGSGNKKDRPPSAPLLDLDDNRGYSGNNASVSRIAVGVRNPSIEFYSSTNPPANSHSHMQIPIPSNMNNAAGTSKSATNLRQPQQKSTLGSGGSKKKSQDSNANSSTLSIGKRVVNFVTPRQRTLSMPQLQFNKLKATKSINLEDHQQQTSPSANTDEALNANPTAVTPSSSAIPTKSASTSKISYQGHKSQLVPPSFISSMKNKSAEQQNKEAVVLDSPNSNVPPPPANSTVFYPPPPPKPPRNNNNLVLSVPNSDREPQSLLLNGGSTCGSSTGSGTPTKPEIRNVLHSWQKGVIATNVNVTVEKKPLALSNSVGVISTNAAVAVSVNNANSSVGMGAGIQANGSGSEEILNTSGSSVDPVKMRGDKKGNQRRRETPRRHTVQSGIDFTTLKRLKQLEQERDVLQQGVSYIETAKDWYGKQLEFVEEKIGQLTKGAATSDHWNESHEERLNLLGCRISEVNSLLSALMDGSSSLPQHMNLQIPTHLNLKTITRLKEQNRQLTQEVSDCSHRVTQLETEKAMLLRQLFHQKTNIHNSDETVYM